jgi:hypothetical protein
MMSGLYQLVDWMVGCGLRQRKGSGHARLYIGLVLFKIIIIQMFELLEDQLIKNTLILQYQ